MLNPSAGAILATAAGATVAITILDDDGVGGMTVMLLNCVPYSPSCTLSRQIDHIVRGRAKGVVTVPPRRVPVLPSSS
jgi:hypothetical protein